MFSGLSLLAASEAGAAVRRTLRAAALVAAAMLAAIAAAGFALIALHAWLSQRMSPIEASLVVAGGLLGVAMLLLLAALLMRRMRRKHSPLAATAMVMAPAAARLAVKRLDVGAVGMVAVLAIGAYVGRKIAKG